MQPVTCGACGASVFARKSSWDQTTLQWNAQALSMCLERGDIAVSDRPNRQAFEGCSAMRAAIRAAAVTGSLDVQSDEPLLANTEHP